MTSSVPALLAQILPSCPAPKAAKPEKQPPEVISPQVSPKRRITFRLLAPKAKVVAIRNGDLALDEQGLVLAKGPEGVWEATTPPVDPGAYRYRFDVDGMPVVDPCNPATSQSNETVWSLVQVPGSSFQDTNDVPHGAVAQVTYNSRALGRPRRMHVYTPPGYEAGKGRFPVLYLLHGASDSDNSWSTVGRAGFILDNLIATGQAKPMVVVMPAGHTGPFRQPRAGRPRPSMDEFLADFSGDIRPHIEANYRIRTGRAHRAIAGLSMGGRQALEIAVTGLGDYAYVGVFSSGIFGITGESRFGTSGPSWESQHEAELSDKGARRGLRLLWIATGVDDFVLPTTRATVELLQRYGFAVTYKETAGGHRWVNWRQYLSEFAPLLFQ